MIDFDAYWQQRKDETTYRPSATKHEAAAAYRAGIEDAMVEAAYQLRYHPLSEPSVTLAALDRALRRGPSLREQLDEAHREIVRLREKAEETP